VGHAFLGYFSLSRGLKIRVDCVEIFEVSLNCFSALAAKVENCSALDRI
jgi:hypothetical protein